MFGAAGSLPPPAYEDLENVGSPAVHRPDVDVDDCRRTGFDSEDPASEASANNSSLSLLRTAPASDAHTYAHMCLARRTAAAGRTEGRRLAVGCQRGYEGARGSSLARSPSQNWDTNEPG